MNQWQYVLLSILLLLCCFFLVRHWLRKRKQNRKRDFDRKLETVLQPKERVKTICPQKKGRCILTSRRLLWETAEGFTAVPLRSVKGVRGVTIEGKSTASIPKMVRMTVKTGEREHTITRTSGEFDAIAKALQARTARKKRKQ